MVERDESKLRISNQVEKTSRHVDGGSIVIQSFGNGEMDIYEVEEIALEAEGYLGVVYLKSLKRNPIDDTRIIVPCNLFYSAIDSGIFKLYNRV
jgi:hypothetical protein